jgi:hypothetical protein
LQQLGENPGWTSSSKARRALGVLVLGERADRALPKIREWMTD